MTERLSEMTEHDDATEERITHLMDTRGLSRADAQNEIAGWAVTGTVAPAVPYNESVRQHPARVAPRPRVRRSRPPVGEDSQDVATGLIDEEQAIVNTRGAALVRQVLRVDTRELTAHERAIERAKLERRGRRY